MYHLGFEPPETRKDTIKCFWYHKRDFSSLQSGFGVVPDGYAVIIFYFESTWSIAYNGSLQPLFTPFVIGLHDKPLVLYTENNLKIIGIRCLPWTVFDLLELKPAKYGVHVLQHPVAQLQSELYKVIRAGRIKEAVAHVEQYSLNTKMISTTDTMLFKAGAAMSEANGTLPVGQVAAAARKTPLHRKGNLSKLPAILLKMYPVLSGL